MKFRPYQLYGVKTFLIIFTVFMALTANATETKNINVYVWGFSGESEEDLQTARKFTREFEEALIEDGPYTVLERRNFADLLSQVNNEQTILRASDLNQDTQKALQAKKADLVIFGYVYDDIESGEITLTVTLEKFDGEKMRLIRGSISRGKIKDAPTRREVAQAMVAKLKQAERKTIRRLTRRDYVFEITSVQREGKSVMIDFEITSLDQDKNLMVYGRTKRNNESRVFDTDSVKHAPVSVRLANNKDNWGVEAMLVEGVPASGRLHFESIPLEVTELPRLTLWCKSKDNEDFPVDYKNLKIENPEGNS